MIKVALVEDREEAAEQLRSYIKRSADEHKLGGVKFSDFDISVYGTGRAFLSDAAGKGFDLVFMDIGLPDLDGMATAEAFRKADGTALIVFVTDMAQFAINGYKVDALDYIVKPVSYYGFAVVLQRALARLERGNPEGLTVRTAGGVKRIMSDDIRYVEVLNHDLIFHLKDSEIRAYGQLKDVESKLTRGFIKCSRYYLVNIKYIRSIEDFSVDVDGTKLQISVRKRREVMLKVAEYFG